MPKINLIAERREEQLRLVRTTRNLFLALSGSIAILVSVTLFLAAQRLTMAGELRYTESKMSHLQPILDNIASIQKDTADLKPKVDTLTSAKDGTTKWRVILQAVSESIPDNTYLTAVHSSGAGDDISITLNGISESQSVVGDMMSRLAVHPLFDHVDLNNTIDASVSLTPGVSAKGDTPSVTFEVVAHLKGAPKPDPKADTKKENK
jgi:Tfp pilus assembly protein PilN